MNEGSHVRVSYIITTRNRGRFLAAALQNVREFITSADELLVMDGASTDDTPAVVKANADIINVYRSAPDCGEAHGFNKGIMASRGRFIKIVTDDDYLFPDGVREVIALMEAHPEIDALLAGGEAWGFEPSTGESRFIRSIHLPTGSRLSDNVENLLWHTTCGLGLVLTRQAIEQTGLLDTTFKAVDTEYMVRLMKCRVRFHYAHVKLFRHTEYPHSGQNNWDAMELDRVKCLLSMARWDLVHAHYSPTIFAKAIGLKGKQDGDALCRLFFLGERIRRGRLRLLLRLAVGVNDCRALFLRLALAGRKKLTLEAVRKDMCQQGPRPLTEELWDGQLR